VLAVSSSTRCLLDILRALPLLLLLLQLGHLVASLRHTSDPMLMAPIAYAAAARQVSSSAGRQTGGWGWAGLLQTLLFVLWPQP
jgi:hypothetical protein